MAVKHRESYARILTQIQQEESSTQLPEAERPAPGDGPDRHERQVRLNNAEWARRRERRIGAHAARAVAYRRKCGGTQPPGEVTNGRKQQVWCVELRQVFPSLSEAARLVGRAPSNILQAIRSGVRCGGFHWERFDAIRHHAGPPVVDVAPRDAAVEQTSPRQHPGGIPVLIGVTLKPFRHATAAECQPDWRSVDVTA